jgi:hypothetical protein
VVTGFCGMVETGAATLMLSEPVTASKPTSQNACPGSSVNFSTVAGGAGPFTYQWSKNGVPIPGATSGSYTINPVTVAAEAVYSVLVTGACGSVQTEAAGLFVQLPIQATTPVSPKVCPGTNGTISTVASGTGPYSYQWKKDGVVIPGATESSYSFFNVTEADEGVYSVLVTGMCGSTEPSATLTVDDPVTATDPQNAVACLGGTAVFTTTAGGTGPFTYQWFKNGALIDGATTNTLTIENVTTSKQGSYFAEVTGACGTVQTNQASLQVGGILTNYCTAGTSASGCQASLDGIGAPSASQSSGFVLRASNVEGDKDGMFFYGTNGRQASPWGNGTSFQCVVPPVQRMGLINGTGAPATCDGVLSQDMNAEWCPTGPQNQKNPGVGTRVDFQLWYRDPASTSNQSTSFSDAIEFIVCP